MALVTVKEKAVIKQVTVSGMILNYAVELPDGTTEYAETLDELVELIKRVV